jgi:hypothetical protein
MRAKLVRATDEELPALLEELRVLIRAALDAGMYKGKLRHALQLAYQSTESAGTTVGDLQGMARTIGRPADVLRVFDEENAA